MSVLNHLLRAVRQQNIPEANKHFLAVMHEKMSAALKREYHTAAKEFGERISDNASDAQKG